MGNNHYVMRAIQRQRARAAAGLHRLAAGRGQGLRASSWSTPAASRSGSSGRRQRHGLDDDGRPLRRHAAADHHGAWPSAADELRPAAPGPHPLQQPRHARQLDDDAGDHEGPRRPPRPPDAHPVPQLRRRRRRRGHVQLARSPQLAEYVNAHPNLTVDVGQVLFGETTSMTGDGPLGYYLHNVYRPQVVQRRHRDGGRLRHRADRRTRTRASSTPCSGRSAWSGTCWSRTPGGSR